MQLERVPPVFSSFSRQLLFPAHETHLSHPATYMQHVSLIHSMFRICIICNIYIISIIHNIVFIIYMSNMFFICHLQNISII